MDWFNLSCAVSSYTGPIHLQSTVLSPSGASPTTPSGISCFSNASAIASCIFFSYLALSLSYFCNAFSNSFGSSTFSGGTGYFIPAEKARDFLKICSS